MVTAGIGDLGFEVVNPEMPIAALMIIDEATYAVTQNAKQLNGYSTPVLRF